MHLTRMLKSGEGLQILWGEFHQSMPVTFHLRMYIFYINKAMLLYLCPEFLHCDIIFRLLNACSLYNNIEYIFFFIIQYLNNIYIYGTLCTPCALNLWVTSPMSFKIVKIQAMKFFPSEKAGSVLV